MLHEPYNVRPVYIPLPLSLDPLVWQMCHFGRFVGIYQQFCGAHTHEVIGFDI